MKDKKIINIALSFQLYEELKRVQEETGHTIVTIIRLALIDYFRKYFNG